MPVRLLVVDDASDARFLVRVVLQDHPEVEVAGEANGADAALEQAAAMAPDVILIDALMPRVTGYELAPQLRERHPEIPLVLMSAHVDEVVRRRATEAGIDEVVGKEELDRIAEVALALARRARGA